MMFPQVMARGTGNQGLCLYWRHSGFIKIVVQCNMHFAVQKRKGIVAKKFAYAPSKAGFAFTKAQQI
jgi:hypothetical protein